MTSLSGNEVLWSWSCCVNSSYYLLSLGFPRNRPWRQDSSSSTSLERWPRKQPGDREYYSNLLDQWLKATGSRAWISPALPKCHVQVPMALENPQSKTCRCQQVKCTPACKKRKANKTKNGGLEKRRGNMNRMQQHLCYFNFLAYSTHYDKGLHKKSSEINLPKVSRFDWMGPLWAGSCLPSCKRLLHNVHHSTPPVSISTAWRT